MRDLVIGLLHPGEMGAAVGGCLTARGHTVRWASAGRGPTTVSRARRAGLADAEGVQDTLLAEWALSQPDLAGRTRDAARSAAVKGWRWVAEMEEIADSMAAGGLPRGFHQPAAEVFRRQPRAASAGAATVDAVLGRPARRDRLASTHCRRHVHGCCGQQAPSRSARYASRPAMLTRS